MSIEIIEANLSHLPVLAALHAACFETGWTEKSVGEILAMPGAFALITIQEENPIGFILCTTAADESEVIAIGTLPGARNRGIGRTLLNSAMEKVKRQDGSIMFLEVADDNVAAQKLYEQAGFSLAGRRKNYYGNADGSQEDALILKAILT